MFKKWRLKLNPLQQAVIEGDTELVRQLKNSKWRFEVDRNGFTALELAQLLGQWESQEILFPNEKHCTIKVQYKDQQFPSSIPLIEFENSFRIVYRPFLTFPSYQDLEEVISNCPYLSRFERFINSKDEEEIFYQTQLLRGVTADTFIKWINPTLGYGLFAAVDLPGKSFIGEYSGIVRRIDKSHPDLNAYCFHYPTKCWSSRYFVIDSLHEGNLLRFINHSDQSNLQPLWVVNRGLLHLIFITKCFILHGTELTFDYGLDYWIHRKKTLS